MQKGQSNEELLLDRINRIFEDEERKMTISVREKLAQEERRFPKTNDEYMELWDRDLRYRAVHPYIDIEGKKNGIASMQQGLNARGTDLIFSILTRQDIESIRQFAPNIHRRKREDMVRLIKLDFLIWLYDNFRLKIFVDDCPFCYLKFKSDVLAREHVKEHFRGIAVDTVNTIL